MIGLIGKKVGMTQVFDEQGTITPVTVIHIEPNVVVAQREFDKDGYKAVVIGSVDVKKNKVTKPYAGQFPENVEPKKCIVELRDFEKECKIGDVLGVEEFKDLKYVDIVGTTKGKGFQGVMKRHNFSGGRATHGSKFHRVGGSTGMAAYPSKVMKGTKMAGRMGGEKMTVQNLVIVKIDTEKNVLLVKGAVPGARDSFVVVKRAKKK